jgi:hypothetical protein
MYVCRPEYLCAVSSPSLKLYICGGRNEQAVKNAKLSGTGMPADRCLLIPPLLLTSRRVIQTEALW